MNMENLSSYIFPALFVGFFLWKAWKSWRMRKLVPELMRQGAIVVDVRGPEEFAVGHHPESLNIPLPNLEKGTAGFDKERPIIVCCASGMRSAAALGVLKKNGFKKVVNAGAWTNTLTGIGQKKAESKGDSSV